jgi:hypothetical protein
MRQVVAHRVAVGVLQQAARRRVGDDDDAVGIGDDDAVGERVES